MSRPFYVTTPIYYVNDVPHLGHAYTTIVADVLARFHHMCGDDARFLTGTDEHGQKIVEAADKRGLTPQALCDLVAPRFRETWVELGMNFDDAVATHGFRRDFLRTTEAHHKRVVQGLWQRIQDRNPDDLYLGSYEGWYCVGCEAYYTDSQLKKTPAGESFCPVHERPLAWVTKETSYFFRLSAYGDQLLEYIERHPHFIQPEQYRNEVVGFLRGGLKDLSVSRTSFTWGIPVPEDPRHPGEAAHHVMYVWFDALTNYLSALGDPFTPGGSEGAPDVERYWKSAVHVIGKDILRFHAVYWPAFLLSAGLPLPRAILCHGWWAIGGRKISKSIPATRVSPTALAADLAGASSVPATGIDAVRYFLLRETPLGNDGDLIYEGLIERYNADLANDLGNLINRSLTMLVRFGGGGIGAHDAALAETGPHAALARVAGEAARDARMALDGFAPSRALEAVWRLVRETNVYIAATEPWTVAKDPARKGELDHVLHTLAAALWWTRLLIAPVLPAAAAALDGWLGAGQAEPDLRWPSEDGFGSDLPAMTPTTATPLFPRIDDKRAAVLLEKWLPPELASTSPVEIIDEAAIPLPLAPAPLAPLAPMIQFADFEKLDLRVGVVIAAEAVPKAKKVLKLTVDLGEERHRTIVAGIAKAFAPDALPGRRVLVVANLAPREMLGLTSEGMILAAGDDAILALASVDAAAPPGTRVK